MSSEYGSILHLFTKQKQGVGMVECKRINLKVGHGIEGDINANPISPRQVLVIRYEDITKLKIQPSELRENIAIAGIQPENFIPGSLLTFESGAAIRLTFHCEPCKRIAHLVKSLKSIQGKRGILGVVIQSGTLEVGGKIQIQTNIFPALPENPYERFLELLTKIPSGKVVTYKQIIQVIGVDNSYIRAIPTYLKKAAIEYPIHRILDSQGNLIKYAFNQKEKLESEGIEVLYKTDLSSKIKRYFVIYKNYLWHNTSIYLK
ncbi:MGMT family protein [Nostoc sp. CENA67]|uniref:MGMT family protein n=2 Tax=Amazonocrinis TaxID=2840440 RepID=A0A8J7HYP0_9NOST|nr:MGMT family protein [Amazonocrinis nigriterrae CENA67]